MEAAWARGEDTRSLTTQNCFSFSVAKGHWASMALPCVLFNRKWGWNLCTTLCCWSKIKVVFKDVKLFFSGGTLRIYADSLKPNIPYKTILLSTTDPADFAVAEALEKYGLEKENPRDYCIARVSARRSRGPGCGAHMDRCALHGSWTWADFLSAVLLESGKPRPWAYV